MAVFNRLIQGCVIAGFLVLSSGCIIAPDHGDRPDRGDRDMHDHDHHCDEHNEHCHDDR
jgi:hypothetical protein